MLYIKSSHRMKPGKGLAPHGASNGANHLDSLVTPVARGCFSCNTGCSFSFSKSLNTSLSSTPAGPVRA